MAKNRTAFGRDLEAALSEVVAHRRGEISLPTHIVPAMSAAQVKAIRKSVAKSPAEFERRFGVPARTVEGWEQGRRLDVAGSVLLRVIEHNPRAVERALSTQAGHADAKAGRRKATAQI